MKSTGSTFNLPLGHNSSIETRIYTYVYIYICEGLHIPSRELHKTTAVRRRAGALDASSFYRSLAEVLTEVLDRKFDWSYDRQVRGHPKNPRQHPQRPPRTPPRAPQGPQKRRKMLPNRTPVDKIKVWSPFATLRFCDPSHTGVLGVPWRALGLPGGPSAGPGVWLWGSPGPLGTPGARVISGAGVSYNWTARVITRELEL